MTPTSLPFSTTQEHLRTEGEPCTNLTESSVGGHEVSRPDRVHDLAGQT